MSVESQSRGYHRRQRQGEVSTHTHTKEGISHGCLNGEFGHTKVTISIPF